MPLKNEDRLGALCDSIESVAASVAKLTPRIDAYCDSSDDRETFVVVKGSRVTSKPFDTQREAVVEAKKTPGAWVESRGGKYDGEVAWQSRSDDNSPAYEAAWNKFKAASQVWREAQRAYRAREIDDAAFLAAKATFTTAQNEMDRATPPGH